MKKILLCCLGLSLCLFLTACSIIVTSEKGDKTPEQETAPPPTAAKTNSTANGRRRWSVAYRRQVRSGNHA